MALGFVQSLVALDAADSSLDSFWSIVNLLTQALLGSPDFDTTAKGFGPPFGLIIYYVRSSVSVSSRLCTSPLLWLILILLFLFFRFVVLVVPYYPHPAQHLDCSLWDCKFFRPQHARSSWFHISIAIPV